MAIDLRRRRAVMARSRKLGHCICNPKLPCPCPEFHAHNVCHCAGERLPKHTADARLTQHVRKAGCASKIAQADLLEIVARLPAVTDPNVLVGAAAGDDAGVYRLDDERALVQTVDVFTPCVDDPHLFGQIAAANSLSDVYAMGGRPLSALSIVGFPIDVLDGTILAELLAGGVTKLEEAGCPLLGGHSINDEEIKLGYAITGLVHPARAVERDRAAPGHVLVLTKALGTGMAAFAAQLGVLPNESLDEVGAAMATLNRDAAELMLEHGASACTDVTGYGLAGHLVAMARGSGVAVELNLARLPVFGVVPECIAHDVVPGAIERNQTYALEWVHMPADADATHAVLYDPQTSGGLLVALPDDDAQRYVAAMHARGHVATCIVGRVLEPNAELPTGHVRVIHPELRHCIGSTGPLDLTKMRPPQTEASPASFDDAACCEDPPDVDALLAEEEINAASRRAQEEDVTMDADSDALGMFSAFMKAANAPGRIDARSKKLMAIALSIAHHCRPCLKIHLEAALKMGIPIEDIDEAANLAVAFGGCTAMMFYKELRQQALQAHE